MINIFKPLALRKVYFFWMSGLIVGVFLFGIGTVFAGTTPNIVSVKYKSGSDKLLVEFNEPVFSAVTGSGNLVVADFTYTNNGGAGMTIISGISHIAGNKWAVLTMDAVAVGGDSGDTLNAKANNIFTVGGALSEKLVTLTSDAAAPTFTVFYKVGSDKLLVDFSEPVWTTDMNTAAFSDANAVANADFTYSNNAVGSSTALGTAAQHLANDRDKVVLDLDLALIAADATAVTGDSLNVAANGTAVYDIFGNGVATSDKILGTAITTTSDTINSGVLRAEVVKDKLYMFVEFFEPVSTGDPTNATVTALTTGDETDLNYTDTGGSRGIVAADLAHVAGNSWVVLKTDAAFAVVDYTVATNDLLSPQANGIYDVFGNVAIAVNSSLADTTDPVIISTTFNVASNKNTLAVAYSEGVTISGGPAANASQASTSGIGDLTAAGTVAGFGAFGTVGDVTYSTLLNTVALNAGTTFTFTMAGQTLGLKTAGSTAPSGTFTPTVTVVDLNPETANAMEVTSVQSTLTTTGAWDLTAPAQITSFETLGPASSTLDVRWAAVANPGDFARYIVYYRATTGVTFANGTPWTNSDVADLGTVTTAMTKITGLNSASGYYLTVYAVDLAGNLSTAATQQYASPPGTGSSYRDSIVPATPTNLKAELKNGKVLLTWVDPTDSDLQYVMIHKGLNGAALARYFAVLRGAQTYTDNDVKIGDVVKYALSSGDSSGNESAAYSDTVSVTVVSGVATTSPSVTSPTQEPTEKEEQIKTDEEVKTPELSAEEKAKQKKIIKLQARLDKYKADLAKKLAKAKSARLKAYYKKVYDKRIKNVQRLLDKLNK